MSGHATPHRAASLHRCCVCGAPEALHDWPPRGYGFHCPRVIVGWRNIVKVSGR